MITCACSCTVPWGGTAGACLFNCLLNTSNSLLHRFIVVYWREYSSINFLANVWSTSFIMVTPKYQLFIISETYVHSQKSYTPSILVQCIVTVHPMPSTTVSVINDAVGKIKLYLKDFSNCCNLLCLSVGTLHLTGEIKSEGMVGRWGNMILTLTWQNYNTPTRYHQNKDQNQCGLMQTHMLEPTFPLPERTRDLAISTCPSICTTHL